MLLRLADLVERHADEITTLEVEETGKPAATMRDGELPFAVDNLRFFAGAARSLDGTGAGVLSAGYTSMLVRRPVGVVGSIAPWNFPLIMAVWKLGAALAAGNGVVIKPALADPPLDPAAGRLFRDAGGPAGAVNVVTGSADVGEALVSHPGVDMVSVTGSTGTGRRVMEGAVAGREAPAAWSSAARPPRSCSATPTSRRWRARWPSAARTTPARTARPRPASTSQRSRYARRSRRCGQRWRPSGGDRPASDTTDIGPLISADAPRRRPRLRQPRARRRRRDPVRRCRAGRARGYYPPDAHRRAPPRRARSSRARSSARCSWCVPFDGEDEAVAAGQRHALRARVLCLDRGTSAGRSGSPIALDVGVTWVNDHLPIASEAPHGGVKGSGFGKDMSQEAVLEYSVTRHIMIRHAEPPEHEGFRPA